MRKNERALAAVSLIVQPLGRLLNSSVGYRPPSRSCYGLASAGLLVTAGILFPSISSASTKFLDSLVTVMALALIGVDGGLSLSLCIVCGS